MPKPAGTCGATKMKIMAIICYNSENGHESYGYSIWQTLKEHFHMYITDDDIRNVYHHLNGLREVNLISREDALSGDMRCFYNMTEQGFASKEKYRQYLEILYESQPKAS